MFGVSFVIFSTSFVIVLRYLLLSGIIRHRSTSFGIIWHSASFVLVHCSAFISIICPCTSSATFVVFLVWFGIVRCQVLLGVVHHHSSLFVLVFVLHCWSSFVIVLASFGVVLHRCVVWHHSSSFTIVQRCTASFVVVRLCLALFGIFRCCLASFGVIHNRSPSFVFVQHSSALLGVVHHCSPSFGIVRHCSLSSVFVWCPLLLILVDRLCLSSFVVVGS